MIIAIQENGRMLHFGGVYQYLLTGGVTARLLLAALLGGVIGLDREYHHKPSGVRTNLLICFGASMFTLLSSIVAGAGSTNKGQIASNIVQGIGFLGAGLILHNRDRVSGLTSAATVWAVASIGMACGAGLYVPAVLSTVLVLVALEVVGLMESKFNLKLYHMVYEIRGADATRMTASILEAMDQQKRRLAGIEQENIGELQRLCFSVGATRSGHERLLATLKAAQPIREVLTFRSSEDE